MFKTLASCWNKERIYEAKIEESEKAGSHWESNPTQFCMFSQLETYGYCLYVLSPKLPLNNNIW